jgi:hypothetical protein
VQRTSDLAVEAAAAARQHNAVATVSAKDAQEQARRRLLQMVQVLQKVNLMTRTAIIMQKGVLHLLTTLLAVPSDMHSIQWTA